jgi:hypothetical protein
MPLQDYLCCCCCLLVFVVLLVLLLLLGLRQRCCRSAWQMQAAVTATHGRLVRGGVTLVASTIPYCCHVRLCEAASPRV